MININTDITTSNIDANSALQKLSDEIEKAQSMMQATPLPTYLNLIKENGVEKDYLKPIRLSKVNKTTSVTGALDSTGPIKLFESDRVERIKSSSGCIALTELHTARGNPVIHLTNELREIIDQAEYSRDIKISSLRLPYKQGCYFHIGHHGMSRLRLDFRPANRGIYNLEGVFIFEASEFSDAEKELFRRNGKDIHRQITMGFVYAQRQSNDPMLKTSISDAFTNTCVLDIDNEEGDLTSLLKRGMIHPLEVHFNGKTSGQTNPIQGDSPTNIEMDYKVDRTSQLIMKVKNQQMDFILKLLLYMNTKNARIIENNTLDKINKTIRSKKGFKKKLLIEKRKTVSNFILVGPDPSHIGNSSGDKNLVLAHHRRGHFRNQRHGPKLAKVKQIYIDETFVGGCPDRKIKDYKIR